MTASASPSPDAVHTEGLSKTFQGRPAVSDLNLQVPAGEVFGLVGPDGAGKTTTFRLLCGLIRPDTGSIHIAGVDVIADPESAKRRIGYLSQAFAQYTDLTVWENLEFVAGTYLVPDGEWQERANELLEASRMTAFKSRLAGNLSGGMKQKLALSCTLLHRPEVLFLDEPTTGVDPVSRRDFWSILYDLPAQGVTIVLSTPYMDEAERCSTVSIINQGRMLITGAPIELENQMPFQIVEVKARPRHALRAVADQTEGVLSWRAVGDRLRLSVDNPNAVMPRIDDELKKAGAQISILREARILMEDVFIYLVEKQKEQA